ncbi:MAG: GNAT family N-acetyltransferase [Candidatus Abyssobacteria bacterium SURF_17]|uniref:GNAT family N-acetyltransferase n=1 Tax=Candidatus Abyssobacteria bacterium SURF_17 TaxID=2093361 RepID=A0A419EP01_9BACT|nr:MAG: GNAT family N-acetyltransferase [Candidatus Abyssubacteria bacterium SURF_17]
MIARVKKASIEQKPILERLMQFYLYDFSAMQGADVNPDGLFDHQMHLDSYWSEPDRFPFLIYADSEIAGFVLVNSYTCLPENRGAKSIAEFFMMPKYRRRGVGRRTAFQIFDKFPGKWEVRQIQENTAGQEFWRKVITGYTRGNFKETTLNNDLWHGPVQYFDTST